MIFDTLGAHFGGVLVSDCLACYENLPFIMHKCYAHHLKAIAQARDRKPEALRSFFQELSALLRSAMTYRRPSSRGFVNTSMIALIFFWVRRETTPTRSESPTVCASGVDGCSPSSTTRTWMRPTTGLSEPCDPR